MNPKVLLIVPHDSDHEDFLSRHPEFSQLFAEDPELFEQYLNLERDNGAAALGRAVHQHLHPQVDSQLIVVQNCPRGLIDANRIADHAIRDTIDFESYSHLKAILMEIYLKVVKEIEEALSSLGPDGIFVDIHTMNDYNLDQPMAISPGLEAMREYVEAHMHPDKRADKRSINLICARQSGPSIAHPRLHHNLISLFHRAAIKTLVDYPYCLHDYTMLDQYMHRYPQRGIGIDVPICELSEDGSSCNINPILDAQKIEERAQIIAAAIKESL